MNIHPKERFTYLIQAIKLVYYSSPKWTVINILTTSLRGFIPLLLLYVVKELVDVVAQTVETNGSNINLTEVYTTVALAGIFFLLNAVSGSINALVRERQAHFVNDHIQSLIQDKTVNIPYRYFEDANYQDIFYRAINEAPYRPGAIFYSLLGLLQNLITLGIVIIILSTFHWSLIPVLLLAGVPIILFRFYYSRKLYAIKKEQTEDERKMHYFNRLLTAKDFAKELRIFNLNDTFRDKYVEVRDRLRAKQWQLSKNKTAWESMVQILSTSVLLIVFSVIILGAIKGEISNGSMAMYFLALHRGYAVLQVLLSKITSLYEDNLFLKNFFEFQKISLPSEESTKADFPSPLNNGITFNDVSFKYPNTKRWVFKNINLHIPSGKTIALVGENGSGKTTLVKMLAGLYQPSNGNIKLDNVDINNIKHEELAQNISVIFQDFMLYNMSASDNIRFGNVKRPFEADNIIKAANEAGIHNVFNGLPKGYDTTLGTLFKDSEMLSRGEWQRTALARSFYNEAQLVILDEPTSSLDAFTEASLIKHFKQIIHGRTAIIVSHRLTTISMADIIVVLKDDGIAEYGEYQHLMQTKGELYRMIESLK
ncbi:ABC transporter ATP-binding protein [Carboxylicivirga sp. N1Y90]|uniref:ABC transporter ATP-binding protein n=1 Tax=Carboxylicivirga fragile TaxID=3417571 RepID=UPI003D32F941|nr:ABC transporter ATP-binding protein [Marinilabiliaceae bacterium N1Y90]